MGIPRLLTRLKDAGVAPFKELGRSGQAPHTIAIIDGPSFAHYVLYTLQIRSQTRNGLEPNITYAQCATEAVKLLRMLEEHGFKIGEIFFDGALPASKRDVRLQRLAAYAAKLTVYKRIYNDKLLIAGAQDVWNIPELRRARNELAPPPFLVSAVLEGLLETTCDFREKVFVVPDEADRFCVAAAWASLSTSQDDMGVAIMANDSDLFVFDAGEWTRVIPLNDLAVHEQDNATSLSGSEVWPAQLAKSLELPNLIELAYLMEQHSTLSMRECRARINTGKKLSNDEFTAFAAQYQLTDQPHILEKLHHNNDERVLFASLDARIAELVQQVVSLREDNSPSADEVDMFLPFLFEDPAKASAWRIGSGVRKLSYEVLLYAAGRKSITVMEYKRAAEHVSATRLQDWEPETLSTRLTECGAAIRGYRDASCWQERSDRSGGSHWLTLIAHMLMSEFVQEGWPFPAPRDLVGVLLGKPCKSWIVLHLSAQYQAMFYSLRMLNQILAYIQKAFCGGWEKKGFRQGLLESMDQLADMPKIEVLLEPTLTTRESEDRWLGAVERMLSALDPNWRPPEEQEKTPNGRKRRRKEIDRKDKRATGERQSKEHKSRGANPFAALEAE
ncbi:hypothetical protein KC367_g6567 [Hortaea werneckii]|uniref:Asteroid domain-containing protein n=2 Tax=Hortaea werneckii TaxID=91943 RepID=A0A3M7IT30_HORWE|nr:hypothetical protein KC358_g9706 [Hortaea werneckii]OTA38155.1 hypothetical protein BTJ68_01972 [Hortaea werneckii EXF-2000]KAI6824827.1 hypothetical protein KC350_g8910 [Hortaea werneckii]KAI6922283.1 hypothetical protein KC348_g9837 [Hortaea werneckii]KAI6931844.1 hypothetical protein KC341_g9368 [Hortaea werneckii]